MADVTLKDIAETVGVNASTVSRALDPTKAHMVNETTVARVREAAKDLGLVLALGSEVGAELPQSVTNLATMEAAAAAGLGAADMGSIAVHLRGAP